MVRRSTPPKKIDQVVFPIVVRFRSHHFGPHYRPWTEPESWLLEHVGAGNFAHHEQPGWTGRVMAFYFRTAEAARRFVEAFPDRDLADDTESVDHLRRAREWAASGRVSVHHTDPGRG